MAVVERAKRITVKDVAQAAGVSTQTVSRVVNKTSYVAAETRRRVEEVVERLGYRPSTLAREKNRSAIRSRSARAASRRVRKASASAGVRSKRTPPGHRNPRP